MVAAAALGSLFAAAGGGDFQTMVLPAGNTQHADDPAAAERDFVSKCFILDSIDHARCGVAGGCRLAWAIPQSLVACGCVVSRFLLPRPTSASAMGVPGGNLCIDLRLNGSTKSATVFDSPGRQRVRV